MYMYLTCISLLFCYQTLADYRQTVITQLTTLRVLDGQTLTVEEKVHACRWFT